MDPVYFKTVANLIYLLQGHLIALIKKQKINYSHWITNYSKTHSLMIKLEQQRQIPKLSSFCEELTRELKTAPVANLNTDRPSSRFSANESDLHILNDGLAYDDSRMTFSRNDSSAINRSDSSRSRMVIKPNRANVSHLRKRPKRRNASALYEQRAFRKILR